MGLVTALGETPEELMRALHDGRSAIGPLTAFDGDGARCRLAAGMGGFDASRYLTDRSLHPLDRTSRLAASAAALALDDAGWGVASPRKEEVGLVLGTMFGSVHTISEFDRKAITSGPAYAKPMSFANSVINAAAGQTAIWHDLRGVNATISGGAASGLQALAHAAELIRSSRVDVALAGGAEELCFESYLGFDRAGMLCTPSDDSEPRPVPLHTARNGFVLGEAAALLVLEDYDAARARGAVVRGEIVGHGSSFDCSRGRSAAEAADAMAAAVDGALADAGTDAAAIDCASLSASGSIVEDAAEARGIVSALGSRARELPVTAIKSMLGETLGAGGALQTVVAMEALCSGRLPGIHGLDARDGDIPLHAAGNETVALDGRVGLITAMGLTGGHCSLLVRRPAHDTAP